MPMHNRWISILAAILCTAFLLTGGRIALAQSDAQQQEQPLSPEEKEAERKLRLKIAADGLDKLYKEQPDARPVVEKAAGYAVFDVTSTYAILLVGQRGKGLLVDNETKKSLYMSSLRAGTGPGFGRQRVYQIFVFKNKSAMEQFQVAGGTGGDISGSVSTGKGGSVRSFNPSIDIYQIPESGVALQASWGGTVYSVDKQLD